MPGTRQARPTARAAPGQQAPAVSPPQQHCPPPSAGLLARAHQQRRSRPHSSSLASPVALSLLLPSAARWGAHLLRRLQQLQLQPLLLQQPARRRLRRSAATSRRRHTPTACESVVVLGGPAGMPAARGPLPHAMTLCALPSAACCCRTAPALLPGTSAHLPAASAWASQAAAPHCQLMRLALPAHTPRAPAMHLNYHTISRTLPLPLLPIPTAHVSPTSGSQSPPDDDTAPLPAAAA
jgi:hypothetical protein